MGKIFQLLDIIIMTTLVRKITSLQKKTYREMMYLVELQTPNIHKFINTTSPIVVARFGCKVYLSVMNTGGGSGFNLTL